MPARRDDGLECSRPVIPSRWMGWYYSGRDQKAVPLPGAETLTSTPGAYS